MRLESWVGTAVYRLLGGLRLSSFRLKKMYLLLRLLVLFRGSPLDAYIGYSHQIYM